MNRPLGVLLVSDVSPLTIRGGAERVLWEQASRLVGRGHRVRIISRAASDAETGSTERQGVSIAGYPCRRGSSALQFFLSSIRGARRAVTAALEAAPADVMHLHQPFSAYGALGARGVSALPRLYTFLSPAPLEYRSRQGMTAHHRPGFAARAAQTLLWAIERSCLRRVTRIHVLSDFSADQLWRLYGISSDRIVRFPGGADLDRFVPVPDRNAIRRDLGLPEGIPLLLTVRNLEARMGLDTLIEAMAILRRTAPNAVLLVGGTGSLRTVLESHVASRQLQEQVRFLGYIPDADLPHYYQAADAFVLPTRELEGFGLITVEALASGTPVLATPIGATPEILRPLDPSLLFRTATPEAMAERLQAFLETLTRDRSAADVLRAACRRYAEVEYDWDRSVSRLEDTLSELVRPRPAPSAPAEPCPSCGDTFAATRLAYGGSAYLRCPRCRTGRIATLPSTTILRTRYQVEYSEHFPPEDIVAPRAEMFASILDRLASPGGDARLLDIGCGGGHLAASAARRGWRAAGTDVSHEACVSAKTLGCPAAQADASALPFRDAWAEAVCLVNILDHTPDPLATLREAFRVLVPGGRVIIRVPNAAFHRPWVRALTTLGPLVRWRGWDRFPVLHLFAFSAEGLRHIAERAGFRIEIARNSALAAEHPDEGRQGPRARILHGMFRLIAIQARIMETLSRGRALTGPSIELYAERPHAESGGLR
jgi:glycosyltransferase involved in cell wall biosynthesis/SAM-dependent methyltransferase